ncbi:MerR family transcriptional regulator [Nakamurella deserti]|uniref:MerR family transcriptional regulator n=1 Tax=Nakamurella deserti TaxID=2164074 RepID=UPI0013003969|nr:MerR family transcriptional regulator [Nakamurella deserti]
MDINELAAQTGVNKSDLHAYERSGLITALRVGRRRRYDIADVARVRTIRGLLAFGMSASSVREIVAGTTSDD